MHLERLHIRGFRNLGDVTLELGPGRYLLWGENAQGKTNTLEAIYYLVTGRSFRTRLDRECLPWTEEPAAPAPAAPATIKGRVRRRTAAHDLCVVIASDGKRVSADGKTLERLGTLYGRLNAVLFTPADLELVRGGPAVRRRFLDTEIAQIDAVYLRHLQRFDHALRQRNALLRTTPFRGAGGNGGNGHDDPATAALRARLASYDEPLSESAVEITLRRRAYLRRLADLAVGHYRTISGDGEALALRYQAALPLADKTPAPAGTSPHDPDDTDAPDLNAAVVEAIAAPARATYLRRLHEAVPGDWRRGSTGLGPHRDDFAFVLDGHDARDFASQGQQRSCVLALRLAETQLMRQTTGEEPILLLDDIVSELDEKRRFALLDNLPAGVQTIITATNADALADYLTGIERLHVADGALVI